MTKAPRVLVHIPIVHSQEDMGSLGKHFPLDERNAQRVRARWEEIQRQVRALGLTWSQAKVYQDGLPDTTPKIIEKILTEVQSPNYEILRWLVEQGVELVGTESPALLREEYDHVQTIFQAKTLQDRDRARRSYAARMGDLTNERDAYIARRIGDTLPEGGVGVLFIGAAHQVARWLPADVRIVTLSDAATAIGMVSRQSS